MLPYQRRWVDDHSPMKIWLAARQVGKSFAIAMEAVRLARKPRCLNLILSASERQSKEVMEKVYQGLRLFRVLSGDTLMAARENRGEVGFKNGSRILSLPASPDTVRGFTGNVFLDEFAFHRDSREIWRAMYPTITRGHLVRITSTPNGRRNMFFDIYAGARAGADGFTRHRTTIKDAALEGLPVDMEKLRAGIADPDAWAQEFECAFIDDATAFLTYEMIGSCEDAGATMRLMDAPVGETYLGVDIGRRKDLTVLWVLERVGDVLWTREVRYLVNEPFSAQRDAIYAFLDGSYLGGHTGGMRVPPVRRICIDSSGLGMQMAEEARERFGPRVEAVTFTQAVKEDLAITLRRRFEDRLLRIPPDREIREDLQSVSKVITSAGNVRFDAVRTEALGHADRFWALALAVHAGSAASAQPVDYTSVSKRRLLPGRNAW